VQTPASGGVVDEANVVVQHGVERFLLENCVSAVQCERCAINIEGRAGTPVRLSLYDVAEKYVPAV
jgi:hypothetical protein